MQGSFGDRGEGTSEDAETCWGLGWGRGVRCWHREGLGWLLSAQRVWGQHELLGCEGWSWAEGRGQAPLGSGVQDLTLERALHLVSCSVVITLKFVTIFGQSGPIFPFCSGPRKSHDWSSWRHLARAGCDG